ncbi:MAG: hypothetical protein LBI06_05690 [Treponema sp.]|nr:hypothetical protein [Treponema sp.]
MQNSFAPERANFLRSTPLAGAQLLVPPSEQTLGCVGGFYKYVRYHAYPLSGGVCQ